MNKILKMSVILLLIATLINIVVHFSSPAYKYYKDEFESLRQEFASFRSRVQDDFVPSIREVATNMLYSTGATVSGSVSSDLQILEVDRLSYVNVRCDGLRLYGCRINGHDYSIGDTYFNSRIIAISPECVTTDRYILVPRKYQEKVVKDDNSRTVSADR